MAQTTPPTFEQRERWQQRPEGKPVMFQSWRKLLFLHWRIDPELIQKRLPDGLTVDCHDGSAWVGVVPFLMRNIRPVWSPVFPHISNFLELNVRTYAFDENGTPGVWFLSLSANRRLAVCLGQRWFRLPYVFGKMEAGERSDRTLDYSCRQIRDPQKRTARYCYRPTGIAVPARKNSLEFFLVERYILFAELTSGKIATGQVHHAPYQIQPVEIELFSEIPLQLDGLPLLNRPPDHATYSEGVDVDVFRLKQCTD